eukprot:5472391-Pyramimonas_sp.AAC.1
MYGVNCTGLNHSELANMRSITLRAVEQRPAGKNATAVLMLAGPKALDPIFAATLGPVMVLAKAALEKWVPNTILQTTFGWNARVAKHGGDVRGLLGAAVKPLCRVGFMI